MDDLKAVYAYHNSAADTSDFVLECMRQGKPDMIRGYMSQEDKRGVMEQVFGDDRACALRALMVLWIEAAKIAEELGLPSDVIDKNLEECMNSSNHASTPWQLLVISENYVIAFAEMIGETIIPESASPVFRRFLRYVRAHIGYTLKIGEIAAALNISRSHLSHTVKRETSYTVHQWIAIERANSAKIMLSNLSLPMNMIWNELGFCSQSHFAKSFKAVVGMSPTQFRASIHKVK